MFLTLISFICETVMHRVSQPASSVYHLMDASFLWISGSNISSRRLYNVSHVLFQVHGHFWTQILIETIDIWPLDHSNGACACERKRHTDRGVSSTPSFTQGGVPPPSRGTSWPGPMGAQGGVPPGRGISLPGPQGGVPPSRAGAAPAGPGWGTPHLDLAEVPPPPRCGQRDGWEDTCQNITFPRTTYPVGNYTLYKTSGFLVGNDFLQRVVIAA